MLPLLEIGLSLGSNLGDRFENCRAARRAVAGLPGLEIRAASPLYETEPVDVAPEHRARPFLNAVLVAAGRTDPARLAPQLRRIEEKMGRVRTGDRNAPRPMDIDILYAGGLRIEKEGLTVPHPRCLERRFVVQPLADVRPDLVLPGETRTVIEVLLALPERPRVVLFARAW